MKQKVESPVYWTACINEGVLKSARLSQQDEIKYVQEYFPFVDVIPI